MSDQTLTEFPPFNQLADCRYGKMLFNRNDRYIGKSLNLYGEYSEAEIDLFRQIVKPGSLVVEVGANIGTHTLFLARQVGLDGAVVAFEPQRVVFQSLCANMALNSVTNVQCFQKAVGAETGEILVPSLDCSREENYGGLSLEGWQQGESTPLVTIDSLNVGRCALLKVDVEGAEPRVLRGGISLLRGGCIRQIFLEWTPECWLNQADLISLLENKYDLWELKWSRQTTVRALSTLRVRANLYLRLRT